MKRFGNIVIRPGYGECPVWGNEEANCNGCFYCEYIGTFGGEYYVDCKYEEGKR